MWQGEEDYDDERYDDVRYEAEQEAAQDRYESELRKQLMPELYEEFARDLLSGKDHLYDEVVEQFTADRLQLFYRANRTVAEHAFCALEEARALLAMHPSAALVFAVVAIEVGLKTTLLKPILPGLVNIDSAAVLVTRLVPNQHNDDFKKLLFGILKEVGGVDLLEFKRPGWSDTLWQEILIARHQRNSVIHEARQTSRPEAEHAIEIASAVLEELFPRVVVALGLKTDHRLRILDE